MPLCVRLPGARGILPRPHIWVGGREAAAMRLTARQGGIAAGVAGLGGSAFVLGWWLDDASGRGPIKASAPTAEWKIPQPRPADLGADAQIVLAKQPFGAAGERAATSG